MEKTSLNVVKQTKPSLFPFTFLFIPFFYLQKAYPTPLLFNQSSPVSCPYPPYTSSTTRY